MFSNLFKPKDTRTPDEKYADMKDSIKANIREVKHQIRKLERTRKQIELDIKKEAKKKEPSTAVLQIKCKSRIQVQKGIERMYGIIANMESTITQMGLQKAQIMQVMATQKGFEAMKQINEGMSAEEVTAITTQYMKEMEKFGLVSEMTDDALNNLTPEDEEAADETVDKVLYEVAGMRLADIKDAGTKELEKKQMDAAATSMSALPTIPM
ncbi:vacuolar protein sorting 24a [Blastocystis sp. ATCC 50177/Nand II]|uniref:Vacuolar protein sorting 24a n=1 Tax=Blastocystis sp. subtype 1 (strain ATCC 50177 / NandII) TaxID=478820 RepID=A0A196SIG7_BLAHN|nr:vacuolar protein sorting 24a [Blastocystis sp. ATCC 50177/Nand II]